MWSTAWIHVSRAGSLSSSINPLKPSGNYTYHLLQQPETLHFVFLCFVCFPPQTAIIFLSSINQLIFVMVTGCVFFAVRTEFLNIVYISLGFRGLNELTPISVKE
jgi:hypothetical protein